MARADDRKIPGGGYSGGRTRQGGIVFVRRMIDKHTAMSAEVDRMVPARHGIRGSDVLVACIGCLCIGNSSHEAVEEYDNRAFAEKALGLRRMPDRSGIRRMFEQNARRLDNALTRANFAFVRHCGPEPVPLETGHVPLDARSTAPGKAGGRRTTLVWLGEEGFCLRGLLHRSDPHDRMTDARALAGAAAQAGRIVDRPVLLRLDSDDATEIPPLLRALGELRGGKAPIDHLIRCPVATEEAEHWMGEAEARRSWQPDESGRSIALIETEGAEGRRIVRVVRDMGEKEGSPTFLFPVHQVDEWHSSLDVPVERIADRIRETGTAIGHGREFRTVLNPIPEGPDHAETGPLILNLGVMACNLLRRIGRMEWRSPGNASGKVVPGGTRLDRVMRRLRFVAWSESIRLPGGSRNL